MRKWNFCAGPAVISEDVLLEVQSETLEYNDIGSYYFYIYIFVMGLF